nr:hypothetical protein [Tanacetum cinerariifolium]
MWAQVMKKFCSDIMKYMKPISSFKKDVIDRVRVKGTPKDKSNSSNDVWEDWSATSIDWEISDNDEENCERMTVQAASEVTECESKGEHDGKIFDMTVDTSLTSPTSPNMIVSIKSIAKIDDMSGDYLSGMDVDVNVRMPDGLQLEDQIVKFVDVEYGDNLPPKLASKAQKNQRRPVLMLVTKQGTSINLVVKPRTWHHRGLLGSCSTRASNYAIDPSNSISLNNMNNNPRHAYKRENPFKLMIHLSLSHCLMGTVFKSHQLVESLHKQVKVTVALHEIESYITIIITKVCDDLEEGKIVIERLSLGKFHRVQVNIAFSTM